MNDIDLEILRWEIRRQNSAAKIAAASLLRAIELATTPRRNTTKGPPHYLMTPDDVAYNARIAGHAANMAMALENARDFYLAVCKIADVVEHDTER